MARSYVATNKSITQTEMNIHPLQFLLLIICSSEDNINYCNGQCVTAQWYYVNLMYYSCCFRAWTVRSAVCMPWWSNDCGMQHEWYYKHVVPWYSMDTCRQYWTSLPLAVALLVCGILLVVITVIVRKKGIQWQHYLHKHED